MLSLQLQIAPRPLLQLNTLRTALDDLIYLLQEWDFTEAEMLSVGIRAEDLEAWTDRLEQIAKAV